MERDPDRSSQEMPFGVLVPETPKRDEMSSFNFETGEDKYKTMVVTPEGSIIRIGGPELKPETDPDWEERKAKRARKDESPGERSSAPSSPHGSVWDLVQDEEESEP